MIDSLDKLTIAQFIELICGDTNVLLNRHEDVSPIKLAMVMRNIIFEYKEIADPTGVTNYIARIEELIKAKITVILFLMCENLLALQELDRVREILSEYGINAGAMQEPRLKAEVKSRLARAKNTVAKIEEENRSDEPENDDIRREFDAQMAGLMAYFKFQIDITTMKATVYAHLIARRNLELKAQLSMMKKN